jgi:hypothetical protein
MRCFIARAGIHQETTMSNWRCSMFEKYPDAVAEGMNLVICHFKKNGKDNFLV